MIIEIEPEVRKKIHMNITYMSPNAEITIMFSEKLVPISDRGLNLTVFNQMKDKVLNLTYYCNVLPDESKRKED